MIVDLAIAQFRPAKADPDGNLTAIVQTVLRALELDPRPRLVVFPETALTGYFLEGGVREHGRSADALFADLDERWTEAAPPGASIDVALGFFEFAEQRAFNSAMYVTLGGELAGIRHVHRKVFLPTYGVFQEERFVEAGGGIQAFDTAWGRTAMLICEDAFHGIAGTLAALDGAEVILVLSASPARGAEGPELPGNLRRWDQLASGMAAEHGVFVVLSQLLGFEGGKGFAGGSTAWAPNGGRILRGPLWEEALISLRIDKDELLRQRVEQPLLADLESAWLRLLDASPGAGLRRET